jgi:hypothetical protein
MTARHCTLDDLGSTITTLYLYELARPSRAQPASHS